MKQAMSLCVLSVFALSVLAGGLAAQSRFRHLQGGLYHGVSFLDEDRGWITADGGRLAFSTDGGLTWTDALVSEDIVTQVQLRGLFVMPDDNDVIGWAVGDGGVVLKTVPETGGQDGWTQTLMTA